MAALDNWSFNSTTTNNSSQQLVSLYSSQSTAVKVIKMSAYVVIALVALLGNLFVIIIICRNKKLRKGINLFILNMAISDLSFPVILIPMRLYSLHVNAAIAVVAWPFDGLIGDILCKLAMFLVDSSPAISILSLVFMAGDRFYAVVFPLKAPRVRFRIRVSLLVCSWLVVFCFISPYFQICQVTVILGQTSCGLFWPPPYDHTTSMQIYTTILLALFTIIPFILLSVMYSVMLLILRKQTIARPWPHARTASVRRQRNNRNIIFMALAIVIVFAVCWGPYNGFLFLVNNVWQWKLPKEFNQIDFDSFHFTVLFLTCSNSALNPCMYFIFIQNYRSALKRLLCGSNAPNFSPKNTYSDSQNWQVKTRRQLNDSTAKQQIRTEKADFV